MEIKKAGSLAGSGTPSDAQLEKINRLTKTPLTREQVYVFSVHLCDDAVDRDFEQFATQSLPKLAELFVGKTGICDHEWSSQKQVARIFDADVIRDGTTSLIQAWAYMLRTPQTQDMIAQIEGGIKKEVSVGCAMAKSICSICGKSYGSCEHRKGQSYGGQLCTAILSEPVDAYEFSFVAVPAQRQAGVMKRKGGNCMKLEDYVQTISAIGDRFLFLGDGMPVHRARLTELLGDAAVFAPAHMAFLRPGAVAYLASQAEETVDYLALMPMYLRAPNAERNRRLMEAQHAE